MRRALVFIPYKLARTLFKLPRTLPHPCRGPRGPFRELPQHMCFIVCFRKPSAAHGLQDLLPQVLAQKGTQPVWAWAPLGYPCYVATCLQTRGHPSTELPQSFRKPSAKYAVCFGLPGLLLATALAFLVRSNTFFFCCNRFSVLFHARTEFDFISATKLPPTSRKQVPSAKPSAKPSEKPSEKPSARVARCTCSIVMSLSLRNSRRSVDRRKRCVSRSVCAGTCCGAYACGACAWPRSYVGLNTGVQHFRQPVLGELRFAALCSSMNDSCIAHLSRCVRWPVLRHESPSCHVLIQPIHPYVRSY